LPTYSSFPAEIDATAAKEKKYLQYFLVKITLNLTKLKQAEAKTFDMLPPFNRNTSLLQELDQLLYSLVHPLLQRNRISSKRNC